MHMLPAHPAITRITRTPGALARPVATPNSLQPRLRAVTAADAPAMSAFLAGLAPGSRRQRFHGAVNPHSAALLRQLTLVDGRRHVAWVAVLPGDDGGDQVVGEARYVREGAHDAELALSVADAWRGRGVADALMAALTDHARQAGVAQLRAEVQPDNGRMQAFVQRRGFGPASCDGGVQVCVLSLARVPAQKRLPRRAWKAWQACQALWARMQPSRARLALQIPQQPA